MSPGRDTSSSRIWALVGVGVAGLAALVAIPGPEFEPYRAPPDPTPVLAEWSADATGPVAASTVAGEPAGTVTPPTLLNYDETLAYLGQNYSHYHAQNAIAGTVELRVRVATTGYVGGIKRVVGTGELAQLAESVVRSYRFAPARDESGAAVPVWMPLTVTIPAPMTLVLEGLPRGGIVGRPAPPGGFTIADLEDEPPTFTPLSKLPRILNPDEVARTIAALPPRSDHWVDASWPVLFLLDTAGTIRRVDLQGSGTAPEWGQLESVARLHRFSPARRDGKPVPVWVRIWVQLRPAA